MVWCAFSPSKCKMEFQLLFKVIRTILKYFPKPDRVSKSVGALALYSKCSVIVMGRKMTIFFLARGIKIDQGQSLEYRPFEEDVQFFLDTKAR